MASVLYAWEQGAALGHLGSFLPLARHLRDRGHDVYWAVKNPASSGPLLHREGFTWLQAPQAREQQRKGPPLSYADIMLRFGYADADELFGLVGAWCELARLTRAELILTDFAPTALLAARCLGLPCMLFSSCFAIPPARHPLPNMRPWSPVSPGLLRQLDDHVCQSINQVLQRHGCQPLTCCAELFQVEETTLLGFPELDHYPDRGPARYWGSLSDIGEGACYDWPKPTASGRIFAYLRKATPVNLGVLKALKSMNRQSLAYFAESSPEQRRSLQGGGLAFSEEPVDIRQMLRDVDFGIVNGSLTITAFLRSGKPLLMLPQHLEQFLIARRVEALGAGLLINPEQPQTDPAPLIDALLNEPGYRSNAEAFAKRYAAFDQQSVAQNLLKRVEELLGV